MKLNIKTIGNGSPKVLIVGCVHGDEIIGQKVINDLKKIKVQKGSVSFLIANGSAQEKNQRWISNDLNRSFPGIKNGSNESRIAYYINKELKNYDLVIDIHATNSDIGDLAVITNLKSKTKNLLKIIPISKIMLARKCVVFGGCELITHSKLGVALEYGPDKSGRNYKKALNNIKTILKNLGIINGRKKIFKEKIIYSISGVYKISNDFQQCLKLKNYKKIKKGQIIGKIKNKEIKSNKDFYPLFLGKGAYSGTLSLVAQNKKVIKL